MATMQCDFCDRPMDTPEHKWDRSCRRDDGHTMGVITATTEQGHEWRAEYDVQGGERSDRSPMTMFVKLSVNGHAYGDATYGHNLFVSGDSLKTTHTSEFETLSGLLEGRDEWDFDMDDKAAMDRYSEDARALRDSLNQVEAVLTEFARHTPSDLGFDSLLDELVEGQRRRDVQAIKDEMDGMMMRLEDEMRGFNLTNKVKAATLRRMAERLEMADRLESEENDGE